MMEFIQEKACSGSKDTSQYKMYTNFYITCMFSINMYPILPRISTNTNCLCCSEMRDKSQKGQLSSMKHTAKTFCSKTITQHRVVYRANGEKNPLCVSPSITLMFLINVEAAMAKAQIIRTLDSDDQLDSSQKVVRVL